MVIVGIFFDKDGMFFDYFKSWLFVNCKLVFIVVDGD